MTREQFAAAVLRGLHVPAGPPQMKAMLGWMAAEGGHWHNNARFNPLNTTQVMPGAGNTGSQGNIKVYRSWQQGVAATVKTLRYGSYRGILHALRAGDPHAVAAAIDASPWGTHGKLIYDAIGSAPSVGAPAHADGGSTGPSGGRTRTLSSPALNLPAQDTAGRVNAAMSLLDGKSSPVDFATQLAAIGGQEQAAGLHLPAQKFTVGGNKPQHAQPGPNAPTAGGGWGGSEGIVKAIDPLARRLGSHVTSMKRDPGHNAAVGGSPTSDHLTTNRLAYAQDYAINSTQMGEHMAEQFAKHLGVHFQINSYASGGVIHSGGHSFKVQILFGAGVGHGDHVHVGVHRVS